MLAVILAPKFPDMPAEIWLITSAQAESMAIAMVDVASQYDISPNPKVMAWGKLLLVLGMVYGEKVLLIREMRGL